MENMIDFVAVNVEEVDNSPPLFTVKRYENVNDGNGRDYSGASFAVRFYVDKAIDLHRVGFVGIDEKSPSNKFMMSIEITGEFDGKHEEDALTPNIFTAHTVEIGRGKGFTVGLGGPVRIPSHYFIVIKCWIYPQERDPRGNKLLPVKLKTLKSVQPMSLYHDGLMFAMGNSTAAVDELHYSIVEEEGTEQTGNEFPESELSFGGICLNVIDWALFFCDLVRKFLIFNLTNNM